MIRPQTEFLFTPKNKLEIIISAVENHESN